MPLVPSLSQYIYIISPSFWEFSDNMTFLFESNYLTIWHERGTNNKSESPTGIEPTTSRWALYKLSYKNSWRASSTEFMYWVHVGILHTARISTVKVIVSVITSRKLMHYLTNTGRALYLHVLSYENSWRARSFNWVHMWQAPGILITLTMMVVAVWCRLC